MHVAVEAGQQQLHCIMRNHVMGVGRWPAVTQASWRPPSGEAPAGCKGFVEASGSGIGLQTPED